MKINKSIFRYKQTNKMNEMNEMTEEMPTMLAEEMTMMLSCLREHYGAKCEYLITDLKETDIMYLYEVLFGSEPEYEDTEMEELFRMGDLLPDDENINVNHLKYINMLDYVLENNSGSLLQLMMESPMLTNDIIWYVYARKSLLVQNEEEQELDSYYYMLDRLMIREGMMNESKLAELLALAVNGKRMPYTYKQWEFHNYISPRLKLVKKLVPRHFTAAVAIEVWEKYNASTSSFRGYDGVETVYPFEKNDAILAYLQGETPSPPGGNPLTPSIK